MPPINCIGGTIPSLQVQNTDCTCVSIQSITWNQAGNRFTITLNNGQSITSPILTGPAGSQPTIEFRVSGSILQYSVDGGSWINLYDLAQNAGSYILANDFPNASTGGTTWEALNTYQIAAGQLSTNGSQLTITSVFTTNASVPAPTQLVRQTFNGSALNTPLNIGFYANNITKIIVETRIVRITNTSIKYVQSVIFCVGGLGGTVVFRTFIQDVQAISGLNLTTTAYDITSEGNSDVIGDITLESFNITYFKQ